ncbi:MAG: Fe-S cluster assembly sulfur transfer protein SufU [Bacilli bacterium]
MNPEVKREIIMEHYQNPINRKIINEKSYEKVNTANESCIDNIDMYILIKDKIIKDICFEGEACAISISSTSIMIKNLIGKSITEAKDYINNFINMVNEKNYNKDILNEALVYEDIYKQSSRKTCATLPYRGILKVLEKYE